LTLVLRSPCKINLFLRVCGKRPDGFHEIETLFERIDLCDEITLKKKASGIRLLTGDHLPKGPKNLVWRAAELLRREYGISSGVEITLRKKIPVSAGLGGGSGDAATVLLGLNRLWNLKCSEKRLLELAAQLGSDVPFFVLDTPFALGRGRGERLLKINVPSVKLWHCLVKPPFGISTREAYENLKPEDLTPPRGDARMLLRLLQKRDFDRAESLLTNTLERSLNKRLTSVSRIKTELKKYGASVALMSGSGSCVFGLFKDKKSAEKASRFFRKRRGWKSFVVSTF